MHALAFCLFLFAENPTYEFKYRFEVGTIMEESVQRVFRLDQIAEGKLAKRLKDVVLLDQPFIRNDKESVKQHVEAVAKEAGTPVAISRFARIAAGA